MRYVITGGSGYLGSRLVEKLAEQDETERIVLTDIRPPRATHPKTEYRELDIRSPEMTSLLEAEKPDALVHLAFILNPIHDEALMYDIDVNGTQNALEAAERAGVSQVLVASSATAYGAWPDNPVPIPEEQPVRGTPEFPYARDKAEIDRMTQLWAAQHPDRVVTIVRPAMVYGPAVDNYLVRTWERFPFFPLLNGDNPPVQFVHEDDVVDALTGLIDQRKPGAFNIGGDGALTWGACAEMVGLRARPVRAKTMRTVMKALWAVRFPRVETPPGNADFIRYPWVIANEKLKREIGWQPKYDSREAFETAIKARGIAT